MIRNDAIPFKPKAVEPVVCFKAGWALIKDQYWLFLGISLVGMLIGSAVPLGILLGPMMCGVYMTLMQKRRGRPVEFGNLFKGFDYFGQSVIATLLHIVPIMAIVIPAYILLYLGFIVTIMTQGNDPNPAAMIGTFALFALCWGVVILLIIVISIGFTFTYPLIADRNLPGFEAVKLSFRAAFANFWRLLGLSLLGFLLNLLGLCACIVGVYLILPVTFAAMATAYEQVFGLNDPDQAFSNLPPPPPNFS
jgi:uncharacterized membrane protein